MRFAPICFPLAIAREIRYLIHGMSSHDRCRSPASIGYAIWVRKEVPLTTLLSCTGISSLLQQICDISPLQLVLLAVVGHDEAFEKCILLHGDMDTSLVQGLR